ncbi:hypothetical protein [Undibacterium sp. TC9W]|uniref:hypothetical protein n=1 Tax=Undibacterium sp. TC9W TaxID=3413053 RepID=UPI003BF2116C
MRELVRFAVTSIFFFNFLLVYLFATLSIANGYSASVVYISSACVIVCSCLVLSVAYLQPEYLPLAAWGFGLLWWTAVCRVIESPEPSSVAALVFEDNALMRLAIELGGFVFLVFLALAYFTKVRRS